MILGCVVKESEKPLIKEFLEKNTEYDVTDLPESKTYHSKFPIKQMLSKFIGLKKTY